MSKEFGFDHKSSHYIGEGPRKCPLCHHAISTEQPQSHHVVDNRLAEIIFICPNCDHTFIAYYLFIPRSRTSLASNLRHLTFSYAKPSEPQEPDIPSSIAVISPQFVKIYIEAKLAQESSMLQICGPGYRKAFEFLIKDYAKMKVTEDAEKIKIERAFSGDVVANHIKDARIAALAKRALWLGNDETHYLRKWEEKDLQDLVTLIELTIHWIEIERLSDQYVKDMPETKRPSAGSA